MREAEHYALAVDHPAEAAALLDEQDAEIDRLRRAAFQAQEMAKEIAARLAEAERDAARYRWLRDYDGMGNLFMHTPTSALDATIDAAIAAAEKKP